MCCKGFYIPLVIFLLTDMKAKYINNLANVNTQQKYIPFQINMYVFFSSPHSKGEEKERKK